MIYKYYVVWKRNIDSLSGENYYISPYANDIIKVIKSATPEHNTVCLIAVPKEESYGMLSGPRWVDLNTWDKFDKWKVKEGHNWVWCQVNLLPSTKDLKKDFWYLLGRGDLNCCIHRDKMGLKERFLHDVGASESTDKDF